MDRPPLIETEVLPPEDPAVAGDSWERTGGGSPGSGEPFHPAAAAMLVLVDNLWMLPEFMGALWITVPLSFLTVFAATLGIQRIWGRDRLLVAVAKALFFGMVAAVPFSVTGTPVGLALLAWAGVKRLSR